jgi:ligand-binding SRPBCC domain-containing protein
MKLTLRTPVQSSLSTVWEGFDETLFKKLSPPFPPVRLLRFDGSQPGDVVSLELNFLLFRQKWTSHITEQQATEQEIYFIDEGRELPFFLTYWRHKHRLIRTRNQGTLIVDEIEYRTPFLLFDYLMYPLLWVQFAYRGPVYQRVFS